MYIWIVRKRVDRAYQAYLIEFGREERTIKEKLEAPRLAAALVKELEESLKQLKRSKVTHFDFIEDCAAYHMIKVCHPHSPHHRDCSDCSDHLPVPSQAALTAAGPCVSFHG